MLVVVGRPGSHAGTQSDLRQGKSNRGQESIVLIKGRCFIVTHIATLFGTLK